MNRNLNILFASVILISISSYSGAEQVDLENRADVLIVTNQELSEAWQDFAHWKTKTARPAKVITTSQIEKNYSGDDIQQKIRACCLEHIRDHQTRWVILGGDSSEDGGVVPDRDTDHSTCKQLPYDNIPTDLYYISETDWDANDDGKYGVFEDDLDEVSYFNKKATIGRVPVRSVDDVKAYTEKVISYESEYPVGDFARKMVYTCPERHAYPKLETSMNHVGDAWSSGNVSRFFANKTPWDDQEYGDFDLSPDNWIDMINERQASKMHIHGHGLLNLWVLEKNQTVHKKHVARLNNERAYPVITTVSCLTGQYDNKKDPCITESMLRQPKGGAIAILAPSREGVPFFKKRSDFRLMVTEGKMDGTTTAYTKFWTTALEEDQTIGEAFRKVKMEMEEDARDNDGFHMVQCELNLLGDPSLSTRPTPPQSFSPQLRREGKSFAVKGIPNSILCIWNGKNEYQLISVGSKGREEVELSSSDDDYFVSISAKGHNIWHSVSQGTESSE